MFVGRKYELRRLNNLWKQKKASFVVIKGRRRIGKSRLAEEFGKSAHFISFSGIPPSERVTAQMQRDEFAQQLVRILHIPDPNSQTWSNLFWHLAYHTRDKKVVILLDEISWMGMKDPLFLGALKTAWDMHFKQNNQLILIVCGSISSWIEKNILSHTGFVGRIDLVFDLQELELSDCVDFWGKQGTLVSSYEKLKVLSITGGVPKYLESISSDQSADEFIRSTCFTQEGFLFREFSNIFHDLFQRRSEVYIKLLRCLVDRSMGALDVMLDEIDIKKSGTYHEYMSELEMAGFVKRHHTWHLKNGKTSKLVQFRLSDNYVRFYLKYIEPNQDKIRQGFFNERSLTTLPGYDTIMGFQFENLICNHSKKIFKILNIPDTEILNSGPYFRKKGKDTEGCQIDYMIQSKFNTLHICEVKFSRNPIDINVIKQVRDKIKALNVERSMSIRPVLIHINGVDDSVRGEDFFAQIIDFSQLLEK